VVSDVYNSGKGYAFVTFDREEDSKVAIQNMDGQTMFGKQIKAVLWNRNRRNRNFLTSGTGPVTCLKVGTGTVINYGSGTGSRYKIMCLISFI
jgi:RNA recognition motif-containing protein